MYEELKDKIALVTGAGKKTGIGFAIAEKLAECGCHIILADLGGKEEYNSDVATGTMDEMQEIKESLSSRFGVDTFCVNLDVTDTDVVDKMAEAVKDKFGRVDILCNNAGASFGVPNAIHTYDEDAWIRTIDVNLHGVYRVCKAVIPLMQENGGSIINTASRAGKVPPLFNGAYAVAKAGVIMMTKAMAKEVAGMKIKVNAVCPGQIMTDLEKWRFGLEAQFFNTTVEEREKEMCSTIPMGRIGAPKEVADLVAYLASDQSSYITGQALNVCGGQLMEL